MTHYLRFVAAVAVLTALALCVPVQAQTPEIDALRARAEAGDAEAQNDLGFMYDNGRDVPEDDTDAVRWYRLAADQGHATAQFNLGFMYRDGRGVPQDAAEAVRWYRLAADQGDAVAQNLLGTMYRNGEDVPQDDVLAHMWYSLSASRATSGLRERAVQGRDRVAGLMNPTQLAEAQRFASKWDAAPPLIADSPLTSTDIASAVTIETREGDTIDAVLVRANESTVEIRVAGQLLTLPMETIRYISFDGRLGASADGGEEGEQLELRAAMGALRILKAQADALDTENPENQVFLVASLNAALPSITTFLSSDGDDWADVNHAIRMAVRYYRTAPDDDGTLAGRDLRRTRGYVDYADKLSGAPGERRHREDAGELRVLSLNQPMEARLGAGDREMARDLDGSSAGAYNDLFPFTLTEPMRTEIVLLCDPCRPHLTLTGAEREKLKGDAAGYTNRSRIRRDLEAETYYIWACATGRGDVGEYTLTVGPRE